MGRRLRPHLPGATFHLTTRVHEREALFTEKLRSALVDIIWEQTTYSDVELFAYVIMPNHLHIVLRQGDAPLHRFMQPILRRAALLVQRSHRREGHVFERRYRDRPCGDPDYIRNSIVYTHLNPVRAGLSSTPEMYPWSSHHLWVSGGGSGGGLNAQSDPSPISLFRAAQLFASAPEQSTHELIRNYEAYLAWRQEYDRVLEADPPLTDMTLLPQRPIVGYGDESWVVHLASRGGPRGGPAVGVERYHSVEPDRIDLQTIARTVQRAIAAGLDPNLVRSRWGGAYYVQARHEIILQATAAGYSGGEIAAFLRISPSRVYDVIGDARRRLLAAQPNPEYRAPR